jgi:hypothetical protein
MSFVMVVLDVVCPSGATGQVGVGESREIVFSGILEK